MKSSTSLQQYAAHEHVDVRLVVEEEVVGADDVPDGPVGGRSHAAVDQPELRPQRRPDFPARSTARSISDQRRQRFGRTG